LTQETTGGLSSSPGFAPTIRRVESFMRATTHTSLNSDINVTPLVDVCLVLLIIFMVVLPTMVNGVPIQLPETSGKASPDAQLLIVSVKEDATVYLGDLVVRSDEVPSALQRLRDTAAHRPIGVRADKRVSYGEVLTVLDACRKAGWQDVTLIGSAAVPAAGSAASPPPRRERDAPEPAGGTPAFR
jgi:biopolymer transport protein ExbD